ncbi:MAG: signal peptidase II [Neisseriaceae bacterium]
MKNWLYLMLALLGVLFDQVTKYLVQLYIPYRGRIQLIPHWLDLTLVYNKGVAFSLFDHASNWLPFVIVILAVAICVYLLYVIFFTKAHHIQKLAAALVIGGSIGNVMDRFLHGPVVDFILFYHKGFSWPVFNLADSFITLGALILILEGLITQRRGI